MILGISASGRKDGITSKTVKAILEATGSENAYISLAGKRINGCIGCTLCAADNVHEEHGAVSEMRFCRGLVVKFLRSTRG